jgi:hypothetical protein
MDYSDFPVGFVDVMLRRNFDLQGPGMSMFLAEALEKLSERQKE